MSTMKICPKCNSEKLKVNLVAEGVIVIAVNEQGLGEYQLASQGELGIDNSNIACACCGATVTEAELVDGMMSEVSNKYFPVTELVAVPLEGGGQQIMTQAEYDAMTAPTIDNMDENQLRDFARNQQSEMDQLKAQMAQLMAMVQGGQAPAQTQAPAQPQANAPKQEKKTTTKAAQTQAQAKVQAPSIATNIPAPEANNNVNVIDPSAVPTEEVPNGDFFGADAPF